MNTSQKFVKILGVGSYVPEKILTNDDLSKIVDTTDEWIYTRTGIRERRIAAANQATSDLCEQAARDAMSNAGIGPSDIDFLIVSTVTSDMSFPSTAAFIQKKLGLEKIPCMDYNAACAGSQYGTELARSIIIASEQYKNVLLVCGDKLSSIVDWQDRSTCVLFGDGAGAIIFSETSKEDENSIIDVILGSNGEHADLITMPGGGSLEPASMETVSERKHFLKMSGKDVFRESVKTMKSSAEEILKRNNLSLNDIDFVIPHQANLRIIEALRERLEIPIEKVCVTLDKYGNTASSSCIIALDSYIKSGKITRGSKILSLGFGAGLTWGASLLIF